MQLQSIVLIFLMNGLDQVADDVDWLLWWQTMIYPMNHSGFWLTPSHVDGGLDSSLKN